MRLIYIALIFFCLSVIQSNTLIKLTDNIKAILSEVNDTKNEIDTKIKPTRNIPAQNDIANERNDASKKTRRYDNIITNDIDATLPKLAVDLSISNEDIERRSLSEPAYRRFLREDLNRNFLYSRSVGITSSSAEEKTWKSEFKYRWNMRKKDALLDPHANHTRGHIVNMAAARPWRVPCGDMNQVDYAVGSCTLPYECPPELRIYRGDYQCGRNSFICCSGLYQDHDVYEAFDPTLSDTSRFSTSSEEIRKKNRGSREIRGRKRLRKRNKTVKARYRRKRFIKKTIRKLAKEVRKELNRAFRNSTENRRDVIRNLKIMIKKMKEKFRDERHIAKFQQDLDLANINLNLGEKLKKIRGLNYNFLTNDTFREIIVNGTSAARAGPKLFEAYPELNEAYPEVAEAVAETRRSGGNMVPKKKGKKRTHNKKDYLEYDIEFGILA